MTKDEARKMLDSAAMYDEQRGKLARAWRERQRPGVRRRTDRELPPPTPPPRLAPLVEILRDVDASMERRRVSRETRQ